MIFRLKGLKSTAASVAAAQAVMQVSSLARYVAVARLISPAEFGVASLVVGAAQLVEMLGNAGADTMLVQAPDGDDGELQGAIHLIRAGRGLLNGVLLWMIAGPVAQLLSLGLYENELKFLAAFPAIRGLYHTDCNRLQRHARFNPWILTEVLPNLLTSVLVVGLAFAWRSHRAVVIGVLFQALVAVALSHIVAERPYRWRSDRARIRRFVRFSWPLAANSLLISAITQGDKFIIGSGRALFGNKALTLESLGAYSAVSTLTMAPSMPICNVILFIGLPYLSAAQGDSIKYEDRYLRVMKWTLLVSISYLLPLLICGPETISLLSGGKYLPSSLVVNSLGVLWAVRIIRAAPTVAALSKGDSKNGLISNLGRMFGLVAMCIAVAMNCQIEAIALIGCAAEAIAAGLSFYRLDRIQSLTP